MPRLIIFLLILAVPQLSSAQFYYKDILTTRETMRLQQQYKAAKVRKVVLKSFERDDRPSDQFICFQELNPGYLFLKTYMQSLSSLQSVLVSQFNTRGQLIRSSDSSSAALNVSVYQYDAGGNLVSIESFSQAYGVQQRETEKHLWQYNEKEKPRQMLKIKPGRDTLLVEFVQDEKGYIAEEIWKKANRTEQHYYYYYNENGHLTDIVRFNERAKKLLPDMVMEYSSDGKLLQTMNVEPGGNYLTWRYQYNEQGLKIKESCYSKQKQLLGYITYRYE